MSSKRRGGVVASLVVAVAAGAAVLAGGVAVARQQPTSPPGVAPTLVQVPVGQAFAPIPRQPIRPDQAQVLLQLLSEAESHGFRPNEFGQDTLRARIESGDPAAYEQLRLASLSYARAQHGLRVPVDAWPKDWAIRPLPYDAESDLNAALAGNRLAEWAGAQAPPFTRYRTLRTGLTIYRKIAAEGGWKAIPDGKPLSVGQTDDRVRWLRARLSWENAEIGKKELTPVFDQEVEAVVKDFQQRHGITSNGVVGPTTLTALNISVGSRIAQIQANMERWRWVPRNWPADRVEVNIPAALLNVYENNTSTDQMFVVAGKISDKTPILRSDIHSVVLNPPWNVPYSIANKELLPQGRAALEKRGFRFIPVEGGGERLQQRPGPGNALGRMKFDFDNRFGVYLHDTSNGAAFERDVRAASHGCVRVQRPRDLAERLFKGTEWTRAKIDQTIDGSVTTTRAELPESVPVLLLYWTVFPEGDHLSFRGDLYGWDDQLLAMLNQA